MAEAMIKAEQTCGLAPPAGNWQEGRQKDHHEDGTESDDDGENEAPGFTVLPPMKTIGVFRPDGVTLMGPLNVQIRFDLYVGFRLNSRNTLD